MGNLFDPILEKQNFVLLDGALATELEGRGADLNHPLWSAKILLEKPEWIKAIHLDYLIAGADIITTSSYQASFEGFLKYGLNEKESTKIFEKSVELANQARVEFMGNGTSVFRPWIAASVGPYGAFLADGSEYKGNYKAEPQKIRSFHEKRLKVLEATSADFLFFETIPSLEEAIIICDLLEKSNSEMPVLLSFSCRDQHHISDGNLFSEVVSQTVLATRVQALGVNCTPPKYISSLLSEAIRVTDIPLIAMPNSGETWCSIDYQWKEDKVAFEAHSEVKNWMKHGAKLIGGCCRTSPAEIQELNKLK